MNRKDRRAQKKSGGISQSFLLAINHHQAGNLPEAEKFYNQALAENPNNADAMHNLGLILYAKGENEKAIGLYQKAIAINPAFPIAYNSLGLAFNKIGEFAAAENSFNKAIGLQPDLPEVWNNLGLTLANQEKREEAANAHKKAAELRPDFADAWNNLGGVLQEMDRAAEAKAACEKALALNPNFAEAWNNLSGALLDLGFLKETEDACKKAVALRPGFTEVYRNLGGAYVAQGKITEAAACFDELIKLNPQNELLRLKPLALGPMIVKSNREISEYRENLERQIEKITPVDLLKNIDEIIPANVPPSFYLNYQGLDNLSLKKKYAGLFKGEEKHEKPKAEKPFRIGFVVTNDHEGVFLKIMGGILKRWQNKDMQISVVCSYNGRGILENEITNSAIKYLPTPRDFKEAVAAIKAAEFDLLYYWEVGSDPVNYFLPFFRAAPVQCTSWGTADSTGMECMDYFISSKMQEPENAQELYSEKLILLDHIPSFFQRPDENEATMSKQDLHLPEDKNLYVAPQSLFKIHPDFDDLIKGILSKDENGIIVLVHYKNENPANLLRARFKKTLPDFADRILFLPRQQKHGYFSLLKIADVILDTLHFGGGLTSMEALFFGAPIVTLPGTHLRGRSTLACYRQMGVEDMVAKDKDDYINLAVKIAVDKNFSTEMKNKIRQKNSALYENEKTIKELEEAFLKILDDG